MKLLRVREDEAAYRAWVEGVRLGEGLHVLMRRIIDAVDAVRTDESYRDRNEMWRGGH